jgi:DNA modification methylase
MKETKTQTRFKMREVTWDEYEAFLRERREVVIEDVKIPLTGRKQVNTLQPIDFELEQTTVWSFPDRGAWATHQGNYRGNWAPQIPRNLILRYTQPGEWVLDPMVGSGTTLVECKLLGRNGIGVDINYEALMLTFDRLNFEPQNLYETLPPTEIRLYHGDARNLDLIPDESIDLIATHPPYANIIAYSKGNTIDGDLSRFRSLDDYLDAMTEVAMECYRVLKPGRHCAILVGDTRRHKHYVPIAFRVMERFLQVGFILREDVIKVQWKMKSTRERWQRQAERDFLLIYHEHLFIFRKPESNEDVRKFQGSMKMEPFIPHHRRHHQSKFPQSLWHHIVPLHGHPCQRYMPKLPARMGQTQQPPLPYLNQVATKLPVHHWRQGLESSCLQLPSSLVDAQA